MKCDHDGPQAEMLRALDHEDTDKRPRDGSFFMLAGPSIKQAVLHRIPTAAVRRTGQGMYACFIDGKPMNWRCDKGAHATATDAWACIGRFSLSRDFTPGLS